MYERVYESWTSTTLHRVQISRKNFDTFPSSHPLSRSPSLFIFFYLIFCLFYSIASFVYTEASETQMLVHCGMKIIADIGA